MRHLYQRIQHASRAAHLDRSGREDPVGPGLGYLLAVRDERRLYPNELDAGLPGDEGVRGDVFADRPMIQKKLATVIDTRRRLSREIGGLKMPENPYFERALVEDPQMFFGRQEEMKELYEFIVKRQCVSLVGQRRIGKSSLLYQICRHENLARFLDEKSEEYIFVYIDLLQIGGEGYEAFFHNAFSRIVQVAGPRLTLSYRDVRSYEVFSEIISQIKDRGYQVVLCLDEFEGLVGKHSGPFDADFFGYLRYLGNAHKIVIVVSSREELYELCQTGDIAPSQFWNIFTRIPLGLLNSAAANRLIQEPSGRCDQPFRSQDIRFVLDVSGTHPFYIQMACYHLFEHYRTRNILTDLDYDSIGRKLYAEALPFFEDVWRNLSSNEQELLLGKNISHLSKHRKDALVRQLKNMGIIDREGQLFSRNFLRFLKEKLNQSSERLTFDEGEKYIKRVANSSSTDMQQLIALHFSSSDFLTIEMRGRLSYYDQLRTSQVSEREIEEFSARVRNIDHIPDWRAHVNSVGKEMFRKFVSSSEVASALSLALTLPDSQDRTRIVFRLPRSLIGLPLEWLIASDIPVAQDHFPLALICPFSKYVTATVRKRLELSSGFTMDPDVRILFIASNVYGVTDTGKSQFRLPKIPGVDAELRSIEDSYIQAYQAGNVKCQAKFIYSKESSLERFRVELNSGYDMVHYAGHGYFDESSPGNSSLFFWDKLTIPRSIMQLKASQLLSITQAAKVRAFYLSCCEGANSASESHLVNRDFLGIMDSLIVASVPTIIGMRWPLPDESAIILASEFYQGLFNMQPFDVALKLAKRHLYSLDPSQPTWASPILVDQSQY